MRHVPDNALASRTQPRATTRAPARVVAPRRGAPSRHDFGAIAVVPHADVGAARHPALPAETPAWSEGGRVTVTPAALLRPDATRIVRHERAHALSQLVAAPDESPAARTRAERAAARAETGAAAAIAPAPRLLAFPPQTHPPWTRVWIGYAGIVGEIVSDGVTVRIFVEYSELGMTGAAFRDYHCASPDKRPVPDVAPKMKDVAARTAKLNERIPAGAPQRIALVTVYGDKSNAAYRTADGKGLLTLDRESFDAGTYGDTISHEGAHAIFEYHATAGPAPEPAPPVDAGEPAPERPRVPDAVALRVADLFVRLEATARVPQPAARFDPDAPPPLELAAADRGRPAGLVMVMDTLWAASPGGHPWDNPDELFASAYGGYATNAALMKTIAAHYARADPALTELSKELFKVVDAVARGVAVLPPKGEERTAAARRALEPVGFPADFSAKTDRIGWLVHPDEMPSPDRIPCPLPEGERPTEDDLLSPGAPSPDPDAGVPARDAGVAAPEPVP